MAVPLIDIEAPLVWLLLACNLKHFKGPFEILLMEGRHAHLVVGDAHLVTDLGLVAGVCQRVVEVFQALWIVLSDSVEVGSHHQEVGVVWVY
jgi:hypothetical protein